MLLASNVNAETRQEQCERIGCNPEEILYRVISYRASRGLQPLPQTAIDYTIKNPNNEIILRMDQEAIKCIKNQCK